MVYIAAKELRNYPDKDKDPQWGEIHATDNMQRLDDTKASVVG